MRLLCLHLTQIFKTFPTVVSFLIGINYVLLQLINKGKLDVVSVNYRIPTTKEQKLRTTCRALIGFLKSLIKNDNNNIGCEVTNNVWKVHKPNFSCFAERGNLSPKNNYCTNAIKKF